MNYVTVRQTNDQYVDNETINYSTGAHNEVNSVISNNK